jgi:hypothetical protein
MERLPWLFGLWMILAPFILGYSDVRPAFWNDFILGLGVLYFSYQIGLPLPTFLRKEAPRGTKPV